MNNIRKDSVLKLVLSALFMALGIVLPSLTGSIPQIGKMLLPMHIPVLLCGFICGWPFGLVVGFITPLLRSILFSAPPMMPTAVGMAFELAVYGAVVGILYAQLPKKNWAVYVSLIGAMLAGRIVWGIVSVPLNGLNGSAFSFQAFIAGAILNAIPGIVLQLVLIPAIIIALKRARVVRIAV